MIRSVANDLLGRPSAGIARGESVASYLIRVVGRLSARLLDAHPTLHARVEPVQTTLVGPLPDQGALAGVLNHLDELGVEIVEVVRLSDGDAPSPSIQQESLPKLQERPETASS